MFPVILMMLMKLLRVGNTESYIEKDMKIAFFPNIS